MKLILTENNTRVDMLDQTNQSTIFVAGYSIDLKDRENLLSS